MTDKVLDLYKECHNLRKLNLDKRDQPWVKKFIENLSNTMPFWPRNVLAEMKKTR